MEYLGGSCHRCGLKDDCEAIYHFHHKDPKLKEFKISAFGAWNERLIKELEKCDLLCANCHTKEHYVEVKNEDNAMVQRSGT